jgi:N-succinyldiaminopimelate aminotransferase
MNPHLAKLRPYPFERLRILLAGTSGPANLPHISMSIGEPRHPAPQFLIDALVQNMQALGSYPATAGTPQLRRAIAEWLKRRFGLKTVDPETMVLPVSGTREALFAFVQAAIDPTIDPGSTPLVAMPNPFYQIYEGATLLAGAEPHFMNADAGNRYLPDLESVPASVWERCQILFLCSPANPTGAVADVAYLKRALELADRYDFVIAADECYSEIYCDESRPPAGLLEAAIQSGHSAYERCVVFHSLSKRSSVPGLRSGFCAGDPAVLKQFLLYRTYHGCALPAPTQLASELAWADDAHVVANRALYKQKFEAVLPIVRDVLDVYEPDASFYLWPKVGDDERFTRGLFAQKHLTVLPGRYIARDSAAGNPGEGRVRISLVASVPECIEAAERIRAFVKGQ